MTLQQYLDSIGIQKGNSTTAFLIKQGNTTMSVTRRYLECHAWKYLLDLPVVDTSVRENCTIIILD